MSDTARTHRWSQPPDTVLRERWDELAHRRLRRLVAGEPHVGRREVVVVPGLGAVGYLLPLVRACAAWTRVHLLDVPGFGHPTTSRRPAALADVVADVTTWLAAVPRSPVLLLGHSTGAQAALRVALRRPEQVGSLVLAGTTFPPGARRWPPLLARTVRTLRDEPIGLVRATAPDYLRGRTRVVTLLRSAMAHAPEQEIAEVRCAVTVLRGTDDALCSLDWAVSLAEGAADGRCVTVPGAHNFCYSDPEPAAEVLRLAARTPGLPSPPDARWC